MAMEWELQDLAKRYGKDLVDQAFEQVALRRGIPHVPEACQDCMIDGFGDWAYCRRAREHVDHVHHRCPIQQRCDCGDSSS